MRAYFIVFPSFFRVFPLFIIVTYIKSNLVKFGFHVSDSKFKLVYTVCVVAGCRVTARYFSLLFILENGVSLCALSAYVVRNLDTV